MIYVCIPSYNEAPTVGLLLWKIRRVFTDFAREYQLLVADDGSTDQTSEVLAPYTKALPLTVVRHGERRGYAASVEELLRLAVDRTDRPKRDCAILMHADFAHDPGALPELVRGIESGADVIVAEGTLQGEVPRTRRWLRRAAPVFLSGIRIPGVRDIATGYGAFRLVTLRNAFRAQPGPLLTTDGWSANAELFARTALFARRIETVPTTERHDLRQRTTRVEPWAAATQLWRAGRKLKIPRARPQPGAPPASRQEDGSQLEEAAR